jgi:methylmalonyl-CoA mutase N-terminal domain/subunit
MPQRVVAHPYDEERMASAEKRQIAKLEEVKRERDNERVKILLKTLKESAQDDTVNIIPSALEAVKAYATIGEICDTLRDVWGERALSYSF